MEYVSEAGIVTDIIYSIKNKANEIKDVIALNLNYDTSIMDSSDWTNVALGITIGLIETVCPKLGFFHTKEGAKALVLLMAGKNESALNAEFYYITAKTQTTFSVYIAATVAAAGSYAAAVGALQAAGFTATVSLVSFAGSGGLAFPVSIKLGVASISSLIASGVCVVAGASLAAVALEAYRVFRADMQLYERVYYIIMLLRQDFVFSKDIN